MASRRVGDAVTRRIPPGFYFGVEHLLSEQRQFYLKLLWETRFIQNTLLPDRAF